ncbi:H/ACA snoRNP pseudouridylase subunit [Toensbergia leucococca]|nr:H/ACA snoRNP pseudouridylase subunit [Toensbergia leucococca]
MSSRGTPRGRGGSFGGGRGGGGFSSRGRGGFQQSYGPPSAVLEMGSFIHACEGEMVCESNNPKIPYFNALIYLENKTAIGKVDEILGPINQLFFTIKPQEGIVATSFKSGDKFYIGGDKLLPLEKYSFYLNPSRLPGLLSQSAPGVHREGHRCGVAEEEVAVAVAVLLEDEEGSGIEAVEEAIGEAVGVVALALEGVHPEEVVILTLQGQVVLEGVVHSQHSRSCGALSCSMGALNVHDISE